MAKRMPRAVAAHPGGAGAGRALPTPPEIRRAVDARTGWAIEALRRLVAVDSVAPDERPCQEALATLLRAEGLPAQLVPLPEDSLPATPGFVDAGLPLAGRPNLVVELGSAGGSGRSLILNSHVDTVPWRDGAARWGSHPLGGEVRDGRLYGRGAVDAKGQIMAAALALLALRDLDYAPAGRLVLQSVVCEEPTGNGTLALCAQGWLADAAVVLEPTDNHVAYGHRGIVGLRFEVRGRAGHAAVPGSGANAILAAGRLAAALDGALTGWAGPSDAVYGRPVLNVGRIAGGEDIFTVPQACTVECGVRYAPGTYEAVLSHLEHYLGDLGDTAPPAAVFGHYDAAEVPAGSPPATTLLACVREVDSDRELVTFPAGCDARHFVNRYGVPAVVFGPGQLAAAHAVDESLPIGQWLRAGRALARFVTCWCG
jgi:acetylornithine deacetylase